MNSRILPSFALMIAIAIFFIYVQPTWSVKIAAIKTAITSDNQALSAASAYTSQQNTLAAARADISPSDLDRLATFLPSSVDNVGLVLDLNALAAKSGLSLSNIDVSGSTATATSTDAVQSASGMVPSSALSSVGSVDLSLSAVGTYTALKTFLNGVEHSERLLDVQELSIKGTDNGVYTYQMRIRIYWLR